MCAMMPMLRTLLRSMSTSSATCEALLLRSGGAVRRLVSPAVVRERPVRLGHLVHVLAPLDRGTKAVARVEELVHQALGHGLLATSAREVDQPAPVSYTHLRAHETGRNLVCRLLLEKKKNKP